MTIYEKTPVNVNFTEFMSLPRGRYGLQYMIDALSFYGLPVIDDYDSLLDGAEDDVEFTLFHLAAEMQWCGWWLAKRVQAFERLKESSFDEIRATADHQEVMSCQHPDQQFEGEWCKSDGIIFVRHRGIVDAAPAQKGGRKRNRMRNDRSDAERMLIELVEISSRKAVAA